MHTSSTISKNAWKCGVVRLSFLQSSAEKTCKSFSICCPYCKTNIRYQVFSECSSKSRKGILRYEKMTVWFKISTDSVFDTYFMKDAASSPSPSTATSTCRNHFLHPTLMIVKIFRTKKLGLKHSAIAHTARYSMIILPDVFQGDLGLWLWLNWSAHSPDLTLCDLFS